jgi:3-deoxy-7-phosphoheptulonate synthase
MSFYAENEQKTNAAQLASSLVKPSMHSSTDKANSRLVRKAKAHVVSVTFKGQTIRFGDNSVAVVAGPCAIESADVLRQSANEVKAAGACFLRGGIFKMRTSADSFQGLGKGATAFINEVKNEVGMPLVSEITDPRQIDLLNENVEMFQVGSRNMYNYELLKELGRLNKPVMLKRAFAATVDEWLKAADYVLKGGNEDVILCERGIRTFESVTRNTLDLNSVAYLKHHSSLPVIVDPSHGTGRPELIGPMSLAAIAAGADGLMIEVHPRPSEALSDAHQALGPSEFANIMFNVRNVARALGRDLTEIV